MSNVVDLREFCRRSDSYVYEPESPQEQILLYAQERMRGALDDLLAILNTLRTQGVIGHSTAYNPLSGGTETIQQE